MTPSSHRRSSKTKLLERAQVVARLRHPNLVRMLPLPGGAGFTPVPGSARRLTDFIVPTQTFRRFELPQVLCLLLDVLSGLQALHELDVDGAPFVHGEVSPQHIYVDDHGTGRLVPLVSVHLMPDARLESSGYLAPEKLLGDRVDARSDVYSVGVMLWEALAGEPLFDNKAADAVLACAIAGKIRRPSPPAGAPWAQPLCAIAERAIATNPDQRFATAQALSTAIAQAARHKLAQLREDRWQDEAPTPVFMPRVHLAAPRSATPPATVVEVPPPPAPIAAEPPLPEVTTAEAVRRASRWRAGIVGLTAVGLAAAGWLLPVRRSDLSVPLGVSDHAAATLPAVVPPTPVAPAALPAASTTPIPSASVALPASAAPAPPPSTSAAPSRRWPVRSRTPRPARSEADYGI